MKIPFAKILLLIISINFIECTNQATNSFKKQIVFQSDELVITQISENAFVHTSYLQTNDFGNVPCNGLVVRSANEAIVFDTPTNDSGSARLISWINDSLKSSIKAVVPTHFHDDCLGGLPSFESQHIPSHANATTIELAKENESAIPQHSFVDSVRLSVGTESVIVRFFGEGHTKDNVVGYFPSEGVLFGGCLIKEINATKGYLGDANLNEWSNTVEKIKLTYPNITAVVPGHGKSGDTSLLDYTIHLFKR